MPNRERSILPEPVEPRERAACLLVGPRTRCDSQPRECSMKLRKIRIENFRQVGHWEHSFTDSLGRVRDVTLLVGPNGGGKTSILDAIAAAFNPLTRINAIRPSLDMSLK